MLFLFQKSSFAWAVQDALSLILLQNVCSNDCTHFLMLLLLCLGDLSHEEYTEGNLIRQKQSLWADFDRLSISVPRKRLSETSLFTHSLICKMPKTFLWKLYIESDFYPFCELKHTHIPLIPVQKSSTNFRSTWCQVS